MADFTLAHKRLAALEAGYVNDPDDKGGETIFGISRRFHPSWHGWAQVDALKGTAGFPGTAERSAMLRGAAQDFYEALYWDPVGGPHLPQRVAEELLDQGVHMSTGRAVEHLQRALNIMNNDQARWPDLTVDGRFGPRTLAAVQAARRYEDELLAWLDVYQGAYLRDKLEESTTQETFAIGWVRRVFAKRTGEAA